MALTMVTALTTTIGPGSAQVAAAEPTMAASAHQSVIVSVHSPADLDEVIATAQTVGEVTRRYSRIFAGFAAVLPGNEVEDLRSDPRVAIVEPDQPVQLAATQHDAPWGLARIDQRQNTQDTSYTYDTTGAGVTVYVLDSGLNVNHVDFGGRAVSGWDFIDDDPHVGEDCVGWPRTYGHGTHVAGTIGGQTYGVAKQVQLVGVRVVACDEVPDLSIAMAAIDWVIGHHSGPSVINASLGVPASALVDQAVAAATDAGVHVVVSAGNESSSACNYSPARSPLAITVGAATASDARASFSNYGSCVDIYAPGVQILSADAGPANTETRYWQGTSMAAPHVAGAVARYLQGSPNATPAQAKTAITAAATQRIVTGAYLLNNHLLHVDPGEAPAPVIPVPTIGTASSGWFGSPITATARWSAPAGAAAAGITGYEVQATRYSSSGTAVGTWLSAVLGPNATSHVADLPEQGTWRFQVRSVAGAQRGAWSAESNAVAAR
jgi:subtilisin family serine protease